MATLQSEAYRIAELAHKGVDDQALRDECADAVFTLDESGYTADMIYRASETQYRQHFESR